MKYAAIAIITAIGAYLRLANLSAAPLWIDEVLFMRWVDGIALQEFPTVYLAKILGGGDYAARLTVAVAGSLTVPAAYWAIRDKRAALCAALIIATLPLFVFWSRMARPYAFAGLFVVIGWRWWPAYIVAVATTPIAALGLRPTLRRVPAYLFIALLAVAFYATRPDANNAGNFMSWGFLTTAKRLWYVPAINGLLCLFGIVVPWAVATLDRYRQRPTA